MRIINFHDHFEDNIIERNRSIGFNVSVLLPVGEESEANSIKIAEKKSELFISFAWIRLSEDIPKQAKRLRKMVNMGSVKGVKFQPLVQHFYPEEKRLFPIYETCQELEIPILFHCGTVSFSWELGIPHIARYGCSIFGVDEIAFKFPNLPIVVAHLGGNYHNETIIVASKHSNIYLDTAYLPFFCSRLLPHVEPIELIRRAVEIIGPGRVLYGWEGTDPKLVLESDFSEGIKQQIMETNALKLLQIL